MGVLSLKALSAIGTLISSFAWRNIRASTADLHLTPDSAAGRGPWLFVDWSPWGSKPASGDPAASSPHVVEWGVGGEGRAKPNKNRLDRQSDEASLVMGVLTDGPTRFQRSAWRSEPAPNNQTPHGASRTPVGRDWGLR